MNRAARAPKRRANTSAEDNHKTLHLALTPEDEQRLRTILGRMLADPEACHERVSYASAVRYAMRLCIEQHHPKVGA